MQTTNPLLSIPPHRVTPEKLTTRVPNGVFFLTLMISLIATSALLSGCYNVQRDLRGDLQGQILLRNTEIPIGNVKITVESLKDSSYFVTYSNDNGEFFLRDVHFGLNKVVFRKKDYYQLTQYADIRNGDTFKLDVELREYAGQILTFTSVTVIDFISRQPVQDATVDLYMLTGNDEDDNVDNDGFWDFYSSRFTNTNGVSEFFLGAQGKKNEMKIEARLCAPGYEEVVYQFTVYYQERQPSHVFELVPLT